MSLSQALYSGYIKSFRHLDRSLLKSLNRGFHRNPAGKLNESVVNNHRENVKKSVSSLLSSSRGGGACGIALGGIILGYSIWNSTSSRIVHCKSRIDTFREIPPPSQNSTNFPWIQFLRDYLLPQWKYLILAIGSAIVAAILNIQIPSLLGDIVNVVSGYINRSSEDSSSQFLRELKDPVIKIMKLYLCQSLMTFAYIYSSSCLGERMSASLRKDLFSSIILQDMSFFDTHKSGEIVSRLTADVQDFKSSFKAVISQGLRSLTQTVGCVVTLYIISPTMTGMMMIVVPSIILIGTFFGSFLRKLSKASQNQVGKATAVGEECISNIRTVRAFAMEQTELELYSKELEEARKLNEKLGLGIGAFQGATNLFLNGIVLATLGYGGFLMSDSNFTPGELMSFLVSTQTIQRSITQLSLLMGSYVRGISCGSRVFEYMNKTPSIPINGGAKIPFHTLCGDIEFKNISFSYPARPEVPIFKDFSFKIRSGTMVALVGTSGGGKSTIAALLERFYDVNNGMITLDKKDIRTLDPTWLRGSAIGYINQEPILFATSVMENIRYGRPNATDEEVIEAARAANAHNFVSDFPKGYDTIMGERGVTVSGGQKQRIAIARALLKNPSILILDEATSALDSESEKIVQEALDTLTKNRTVLVIAHRLSTVQNADLIAVLDKGVIAESGTHEQLKKANGLYANLVKQQLNEKVDANNNNKFNRFFG